jgi:protein-L-isoaspartate(D-aspartate) O-methyltransferase
MAGAWRRSLQTRHVLGKSIALLVLAAACVALLLSSLRLSAQQAENGRLSEPPVGTRPATSQPDYRDKQGRPHWPRPRTRERQAERDRMVDQQIAPGAFFRGAVRDADVLAAMRTVPRHAFVPPQRRGSAYADTPLPIGHGQTISQPYIVALMTAQLQLKPGEKVLEIGTGSGYQAAVLSELTPHVYTIEIVRPLYEEVVKRFEKLEYPTIKTRQADGYDGWPEHAPFDAIIVTCAAGHVPPPLWEQLKPGGRMVIPIGGVHEVQRLIVLTKQPDGRKSSQSILPVRFVPMVGRAQDDD